jgi:hypothetical protein
MTYSPFRYSLFLIRTFPARSLPARRLFQAHDGAVCHGRDGRHPPRLSGEATLTEEYARGFQIFGLSSRHVSISCVQGEGIVATRAFRRCLTPRKDEAHRRRSP